MRIENSTAGCEILTGALSGEGCLSSQKKLSQIPHLFKDQKALANMDPETVVYSVQSHEAVAAGTEGGLFFGTSTVHPGQVGNEYFMTKGHYHSRRETAEYYWGISGEGVLLLMNEDGTCRAERVENGSLHYIPGFVARRLVNTGKEDLVVGACWYSDAGHDYGSIETKGFPVRVVCENGKPTLTEN